MFGFRSRKRALPSSGRAAAARPTAVTRTPSPWSASLPVRLSHSSEQLGRSSICCALRACSGVATKISRRHGDAAYAIRYWHGARSASVVARTHCTCDASSASTSSAAGASSSAKLSLAPGVHSGSCDEAEGRARATSRSIPDSSCATRRRSVRTVSPIAEASRSVTTAPWSGAPAFAVSSSTVNSAVKSVPSARLAGARRRWRRSN
mmetsp:Transcript_24010/g.78441  ORF Transcript_24010/g.78441 Transcript_24010/m.78441 type:complete len:207 (+) Transcript_24010:165-785(+)